MTTTTAADPAPLVLIVEDDEQMRMMLRRMMERAGNDVIEARNGDEGVQLYKLAEPDAVLLDVMMPGMNGIEAARAMRSMQGRDWIPILMLTARDKVEDRVRGLDAGADDFLTKPFNGSELIARVRALLRLRQEYARLRRDYDRLLQQRDELETRHDALRQLVGRSVEPETADALLQQQARFFPDGEPVRLSVLYADVTGFTRFSERRGPREALQALNTIWNALIPLLFAYQGTFDKYVGDAFMAFFGVPIRGVNDPATAVRCALEMLQRFAMLTHINPRLAELGLGIAIVTGDAVAGNAGSDEVMDFTAIGPAPAGAKMLQSLCSGGQLLICQSTYDAVAAELPAQPLSPLELPGSPEPTRIYAVSAPAR